MGKASDIGGITDEMLKYGREAVDSWMHLVCTVRRGCLNTRQRQLQSHSTREEGTRRHSGRGCNTWPKGRHSSLHQVQFVGQSNMPLTLVELHFLCCLTWVEFYHQRKMREKSVGIVIAEGMLFCVW